MDSFLDTALTIGFYVIVALGIGVAFVLFLALPARWLRRTREDRRDDRAVKDPPDPIEHEYRHPPPPFPS